MKEREQLTEARIRLIETGGRTSQDLGAGRMVGQVLVYLYLQPTECSLDSIAEELGVSKASVSIAARQLEHFGLVRKIWKSGDKRNYYRSAENIAKALQQGLLLLLRQKVELFGVELEGSLALLQEETAQNNPSKEQLFLQRRVERALQLQNELSHILGSPLIRLLASLSQFK